MQINGRTVEFGIVVKVNAYDFKTPTVIKWLDGDVKFKRDVGGKEAMVYLYPGDNALFTFSMGGCSPELEKILTDLRLGGATWAHLIY